jgi:hypothetical protein
MVEESPRISLISTICHPNSELSDIVDLLSDARILILCFHVGKCTEYKCAVCSSANMRQYRLHNLQVRFMRH